MNGGNDLVLMSRAFSFCWCCDFYYQLWWVLHKWEYSNLLYIPIIGLYYNCYYYSVVRGNVFPNVPLYMHGSNNTCVEGLHNKKAIYSGRIMY